MIDDALRQCTNIYEVCYNSSLLTSGIDKSIKYIQNIIAGIVNNFDGVNFLNTFVAGQIWLLEVHISTLERDKDKIIWRAKELIGLVSPWLDTLYIHKKECLDTMGKPTPIELKEKESHAYVLNGLVPNSRTFKFGWDTYLELLKNAYPKCFKLIQL